SERSLGARLSVRLEEEKRALEPGEEAFGWREAASGDSCAVVPGEEQPPARADVRVVITGRPAQPLDLDVGGVDRQRLRRGPLTSQGPEGVDQRHAYRARRAEAAVVFGLDLDLDVQGRAVVPHLQRALPHQVCVQ